MNTVTPNATEKFMPVKADRAGKDALITASKGQTLDDAIQIDMDVGSVNQRAGIAMVNDGELQLVHLDHFPNLVAEPKEGNEDFLTSKGCKIVDGLVYGENVLNFARYVNPLAGVIKQTQAIQTGNFGGFDKLQRQGLDRIASKLTAMNASNPGVFDGISRVAVVSAIPGGMSTEYEHEVTRLGLAAAQEVLAPVFGGKKPSYNIVAETNCIARGLNLKAPLAVVNFGGGTIEIAYFLGGSWNFGKVAKNDVTVDWGHAGQSIDEEVKVLLEQRFDAAGVTKSGLYLPATLANWKHQIFSPVPNSSVQKSGLLEVTLGDGSQTYVNVKGVAQSIMRTRINDLARRFADHTATLAFASDEERDECLAHTVVYGGTTAAAGFAEQFESALKAKLKGSAARAVKTYCAPDAMYGVLKGASVNGADILANNKQVYAQKKAGLGL
ncbi:MAG: hypothetical protein Q7K43_06405 [Candidatus Woesearchaeota archaeon]|nr:hypothetical protein [Candidatus Woesearchaeota archaeon]